MGTDGPRLLASLRECSADDVDTVRAATCVSQVAGAVARSLGQWYAVVALLTALILYCHHFCCHVAGASRPAGRLL